MNDALYTLQPLRQLPFRQGPTCTYLVQGKPCDRLADFMFPTLYGDAYLCDECAHKLAGGFFVRGGDA